MLDAVLGIFPNLLLFFIIGFWPAFWLSSSKNRLLIAVAIAPTIGFAITSIIATYLILMDYPVKIWSSGYVFVCIAISVMILLFYIIKKRAEFRELIVVKEKESLWLIAGFVIVSIVIVLPMLLGGFQFTLFRGNASDSFNYMLMGEYLDHEPLSGQNAAFLSETLQKGQLYELTRRLLGTRWTTSAVLAFSSRVASVPINQLEYSYSILFFILAVGPAFILARKANLDNAKALVIGLIMCAGFWAQFVLDTRAFSQINSIPLMLAICFLIPFDTRHSQARRFKEPVLLGILGASLIFSYPEVVPLCTLSVFLFTFVQFIKKALTFDFFLFIGNTLLILILLCLPNIHFIVSFMLRQLTYAVSSSNNWDKFYYPWLFSDPILGIWGLSPFLVLKRLFATQILGVTIQLLLILLGVALSGIVLATIVMAMILKRADNVLVVEASFVCVTIIQFLFLFFNQQWWAAGKAVAFGYPFFLLLITASGWTKQIFPFSSSFVRVITGCVWVWAILQLMLFGWRSINAVTRKEYFNYMIHNGYYRQHDFDLSPLQKSLGQSGPSNIWVLIQAPPYIDYLNLVFGWDHHVFNFSDVIHKMEGLDENANGKHLPDFLIVYKDQCKLTDQKEVASNSEIALVRYSPSKFVCFDVSNPNGVEFVNNEEFYWLGDEKTLLEIQSSFAGNIAVIGDFTMGPSLPDMVERNLQVTSRGKEMAQSFLFVIRPGRNTIEIPVHKGNNQFELSVLNKPTVSSLPNGDPRVLLLALQNIRIQFEDSVETK